MKEELGETFIDKLEGHGLLRFERIAKTYPCRCWLGCACTMRVRQVEPGKYIGLCGSSPMQCQKVRFNPEDVEVIGVSIDPLCESLRNVLGIRGRPKELERLERVYRLGVIPLGLDDKMPVYFIAQPSRKEYDQALELLWSREPREKRIVLVPTEKSVSDLLARHMGVLGTEVVPLSKHFGRDFQASHQLLETLVSSSPTEVPLEMVQNTKVIAQVLTQDGWSTLTQAQYEQLCLRKSSYDVFVDGFRHEVVRTEGDQTAISNITLSQLRMLHRAVTKHGRFDPCVDVAFENMTSAKQIFLRMRKLIDMKRIGKDGRETWVLFPTVIDHKVAFYTFEPHACRYAFVFPPEEPSSSY